MRFPTSIFRVSLPLDFFSQSQLSRIQLPLSDAQPPFGPPFSRLFTSSSSTGSTTATSSGAPAAAPSPPIPTRPSELQQRTFSAPSIPSSQPSSSTSTISATPEYFHPGSGFCEVCCESYAELRVGSAQDSALAQHIRSSKHQKFTRSESNYLLLDQIASLVRVDQHNRWDAAFSSLAAPPTPSDVANEQDHLDDDEMIDDEPQLQQPSIEQPSVDDDEMTDESVRMENAPPPDQPSPRATAADDFVTPQKQPHPMIPSSNRTNRAADPKVHGSGADESNESIEVVDSERTSMLEVHDAIDQPQPVELEQLDRLITELSAEVSLAQMLQGATAAPSAKAQAKRSSRSTRPIRSATTTRRTSSTAPVSSPLPPPKTTKRKRQTEEPIPPPSPQPEEQTLRRSARLMAKVIASPEPLPHSKSLSAEPPQPLVDEDASVAPADRFESKQSAQAKRSSTKIKAEELMIVELAEAALTASMRKSERAARAARRSTQLSPSSSATASEQPMAQSFSRPSAFSVLAVDSDSEQPHAAPLMSPASRLDPMTSPTAALLAVAAAASAMIDTKPQVSRRGRRLQASRKQKESESPTVVPIEALSAAIDSVFSRAPDPIVPLRNAEPVAKSDDEALIGCIVDWVSLHLMIELETKYQFLLPKRRGRPRSSNFQAPAPMLPTLPVVFPGARPPLPRAPRRKLSKALSNPLNRKRRSSNRLQQKHQIKSEQQSAPKPLTQQQTSAVDPPTNETEPSIKRQRLEPSSPTHDQSLSVHPVPQSLPLLNQSAGLPVGTSVIEGHVQPSSVNQSHPHEHSLHRQIEPDANQHQSMPDDVQFHRQQPDQIMSDDADLQETRIAEISNEEVVHSVPAESDIAQLMVEQIAQFMTEQQSHPNAMSLPDVPSKRLESDVPQSQGNPTQLQHLSHDEVMSAPPTVDPEVPEARAAN